ncbi:hypothetical protein FHT70_004740 [Rhizobium sp. BK049]|nr:hypothetical protein [Rhizobium sp. BK049]
MYSGAQVSLYRTSGNSVGIPIDALKATAPNRIETDALDRFARTARRKPEIERR